MSGKRVQVVVLAGGLATRMRPRTDAVPKLLLPVAGRPFAAWLLERLVRCGVSHVVLCVGHLADQIVGTVGDGARFGLPSPVTYVHDGAAPLGTAGALCAALPHLDEELVVTYGDSYLPFDYASPLADLRAHEDALGTLAVLENAGRWDASNTIVEGSRVVRYDKHPGDDERGAFRYIDYGAMALRRSVVERLPAERPLGLERVQADLAASGRLRALIAPRRFYEIGSEAGLADLEGALVSGLALD